jgi:hypothetical protein
MKRQGLFGKDVLTIKISVQKENNVTDNSYYDDDENTLYSSIRTVTSNKGVATREGFDSMVMCTRSQHANQLAKLHFMIRLRCRITINITKLQKICRIGRECSIKTGFIISARNPFLYNVVLITEDGRRKKGEQEFSCRLRKFN